MKILIPTAKELNLNTSSSSSNAMTKTTQLIVEELVSYSIEELQKLYKISSARAKIEYNRLKDIVQEQALYYPALYLFDGLMYRHIKRENYSKQEKRYIEKNLFITSALYGVIPALERIAPHRLDFMVSMKLSGKNLKIIWREAYNQKLENENLIFSLLSSEFETVFSKEIRNKFIRFKFLEEKEETLKMHSTISKKARGEFLTALIENQVEKLEEIKQLTFDNFAYRPDLSTEKEFVFVKVIH
ncbi:MAG: peroxide stress protein YaaA [Streptococcus sp.]|nr:peroxide stress protein YaaA [Streptococcus sp.]